jgi:hypothetical protein
MTRTVIVTGARAPSALHLARIFHEAGHRVVLADTFLYPMSRATRMKDHYARLPSPRRSFSEYAAAVKTLVAGEAPDLVVPTCEEVFFLAALRGLGADPPLTLRIEHPEDLSRLSAPTQSLVFKPAWSRFGSRVLIRPSETEISKLRPTEADPWVAQSYLPGEEISAHAVGMEGRLIALQSYRPTYRVGQGAGVAFEAADVPVARQFVSALISKLNWTGQISFDFRRDEEGDLHVIECNPRTTSGVHYFGPGDGLARSFLDGAAAQASLAGAMTLPLAMLAYGLPYALRRDGLAQWWRDFAGMQDISSWPGDRNLLLAQLLALGEIALKAVREGRGLVDASVRDIEWDGEPLGQKPAKQTAKATIPS